MVQKDTLVVLAHGFCRNGQDMHFWRDQLKELYSDIVVADMPTTHSSFERCLRILTDTINKAHPERYRNIYFCGHSMGGLLLREYLKRCRPANARKLICVGTPHYGSKLADIALCIPGSGLIYPPLWALRRGARKTITSPDLPDLEIGVIVSTLNAHWPGKLFLSSESDGLVERSSAHAPDADAAAYVKVPHDYMQRNVEVADLIKKFFKDSIFCDVSTEHLSCENINGNVN